MKNGRTRILENQGFRTCRFYFIKIYMEFDYYLSINVVFWDNLSNLFLCNCHKKYSFSIRIVISEFLPKRSYFLPKTQTILHYLISSTSVIDSTGAWGCSHQILFVFVFEAMPSSFWVRWFFCLNISWNVADNVVVTFDIFTFLIFVKMSICQFAFLVKRHRITVQSIHIKLFSQDASSGFIYNLRHPKNSSIISKENDGDISPYLFL